MQATGSCPQLHSFQICDLQLASTSESVSYIRGIMTSDVPLYSPCSMRFWNTNVADECDISIYSSFSTKSPNSSFRISTICVDLISLESAPWRSWDFAISMVFDGNGPSASGDMSLNAESVIVDSSAARSISFSKSDCFTVHTFHEPSPAVPAEFLQSF